MFSKYEDKVWKKWCSSTWCVAAATTEPRVKVGVVRQLVLCSRSLNTHTYTPCCQPPPTQLYLPSRILLSPPRSLFHCHHHLLLSQTTLHRTYIRGRVNHTSLVLHKIKPTFFYHRELNILSAPSKFLSCNHIPGLRKDS